MIDIYPSLDAIGVLRHPFFWSPARRLNFLQDVSDRLEIESRELQGSSKVLGLLEKHANKVVGPDWTRKIHRHILDDLSKYRSYDGTKIQDLLRALRNKVLYID